MTKTKIQLNILRILLIIFCFQSINYINRVLTANYKSIQLSIINIPVWALLVPNNNIYFGKNAFEQWAESLLCDGYFKNEDEALNCLCS